MNLLEKLEKFFHKSNPVTLTIIVGLLCVVIGWELGQCNLSFLCTRQNFGAQAFNQYPPGSAQVIDFKLFWQTWDLVSKKYVDKKAVDPQKMYYGAIQGMVSALGDPYTLFLAPDSQKATKEELGGSFEGVGIQLGYNKDKRLVVIAPVKDTPADKAGIKPGDIIVKIEGKDATTISLPDAVTLIRGPKGSKVSLELYREGEDKTRQFSLERDTIVVKSAEYTEKKTPQGKKIAYIKLSRFGERTATEWEQAVSSTLVSGDEGVILDLRNNPGGYLEGARFIGSEFLDYGKNVVLQEDGQGQRQPYPVNRTGRLINVPLEVLINKGSASASEIVAGAIQDYRRGKLVGEQSFGKGTIQETQDLPCAGASAPIQSGGNQGCVTGLHITTAKWLTPNGRWIHNQGLSPDVKVEASASADPVKDIQLDRALVVFDQPS